MNKIIVIKNYLSGTLKQLEYHNKYLEEEKANILYRREINSRFLYNSNQVELNLPLTQ